MAQDIDDKHTRVPKTLHLCWFSGDKYPVEIQRCLDSWARVLPDYRIRLWTADDARAIGCRYIDQALEMRKWAFAADAVRFYALWKEGGVYLDSDILLYRRFDRFIPVEGFATFHEHIGDQVQLQAAFLIGSAGNAFCREAYAYYAARPFIAADGSPDMTISPVVMLDIAKRFGYTPGDRDVTLEENTYIYEGKYVTPCNRCDDVYPGAVARHTIYGSWRKRKFGRRVELAVKHFAHVIQYRLGLMR